MAALADEDRCLVGQTVGEGEKARYYRCALPVDHDWNPLLNRHVPNAEHRAHAGDDPQRGITRRWSV